MPSFPPKCLPDGPRYVCHAEREKERERGRGREEERREGERGAERQECEERVALGCPDWKWQFSHQTPTVKTAA